MKEKVYNFGVFNNWRGYIDLYFNRKELAEIKRQIKANGRNIGDIKEYTIKQIYEML